MPYPLTGQPIRQRWHILECLSGQEARLSAALAAFEVQTAYPVTQSTWVQNGKRRTRDKPAVAGYVFAKFHRAPVWHSLKSRALITGVVWRATSEGPVPYEATGDEVRQFMGLPTKADELEAAERERQRVRPGDDVIVLLPSEIELAAKALEVTGGRVSWEAGVMKGTADVGAVRKIG